jgi:putative membrane protein
MNPAPVPYCGSPPVPGHLAWNGDPVLAAVLIGCAAAYWLATRKVPLPHRAQLCFWAGWTIAAFVFVSPFCNLGVALFSARIAQHVLLTTLAAPLLVLGGIGEIAKRLAGLGQERLAATQQGGLSFSLAGFVFAVVMWAWHVPVLYDATFHSTKVYWAMHATMLIAAVWLWLATLRSNSQTLFWSLSTIVVTMLQMGLLGALLTFAAKPLYGVHASTTWTWGLSPLEDQQLGGLFMWVIGGVLVIAWSIIVFAEYLTQDSTSRFHLSPGGNFEAIPKSVVGGHS